MNPNNTNVRKALMNSDVSHFSFMTNQRSIISTPSQWDDCTIGMVINARENCVRVQNPDKRSKLIAIIRCISRNPYYLVLLTMCDNLLSLPDVTETNWDKLSNHVNSMLPDVVGGFELQGQIESEDENYIIYQSKDVCISPSILKQKHIEVVSVSEILYEMHVGGILISSKTSKSLINLDYTLYRGGSNRIEQPYAYYAKRGSDIPHEFRPFIEMDIGVCDRWLLFLGRINLIGEDICDEETDTLIAKQNGETVLSHLDSGSKIFIGTYSKLL